MNLTIISDVKVAVLQEDGSSREMGVEDSPYYITLSTHDRRIYDNYLGILMKVSGAPMDEMRYFTFMRTCEDVRRRGFMAMRPRIRFNEGLTCLDGHHRLAMLLYCHGPNLALEIINGEVESLWVKSNK